MFEHKPTPKLPTFSLKKIENQSFHFDLEIQSTSIYSHSYNQPTTSFSSGYVVYRTPNSRLHSVFFVQTDRQSIGWSSNFIHPPVREWVTRAGRLRSHSNHWFINWYKKVARPANPTMRKILLAIIKVVLLKVFSLVFFCLCYQSCISKMFFYCQIKFLIESFFSVNLFLFFHRGQNS